jgi:hypothetical protein
MTSPELAQRSLALYRQYSDMARRTSGDLRGAYERMARDMLRRAATLDPAAVAEASAAAMTSFEIGAAS